MKNDHITNTTQTLDVIMKHIQHHVDHPIELFTDLFVSLTGENATAIEAGGTSTQIVDTFANTTCRDFFIETQ